MTLVRPRALRRALLAAAALLALIPAVASADTGVSVFNNALHINHIGGTTDGPSQIFVDDSEPGFLVVEEHNPDLVLLAGIGPGEGCSRPDVHTVRCDSGTVTSIEMVFGDGDDEALPDGSPLPRTVQGEGGDDTLAGSAGADTLDGGTGDDVLVAGEGDDEFIGGDDEDELTYEGYEADVTATLPDLGDPPTTGNGEQGAESDTIHDDVEDVTGGEAIDHLTGNSQANRLAGEDVIAAGGADELVAQGVGASLLAGEGDDVIRADNGVTEDLIDCGPDTDRVDADNGPDDGAEMDCEFVAPELEGTVSLVDNQPFVGGLANVSLPTISTGAETSQDDGFAFSIDWYRCAGDDCELVQSGNIGTYVYSRDDEGREVFARLAVSNNAGEDSGDSEWSGVIGPAPFNQSPPLFPPGFDPANFVPPGNPGDTSGADIAAAISAWAQGVLKLLEGQDAGTLARRKTIASPPFQFPGSGLITINWTLPPPPLHRPRHPVARHPGAKGAAVKRIVLARGRKTGAAGQSARVKLTLTKAGRKALKRFKRPRIGVTITFTPSDVNAKPTVLKRSVKLKRRKK